MPSPAATVWSPQSGEGEYDLSAAVFLVDPTDSSIEIIDPTDSSVAIIDTGVTFTGVAATVWVANESA